MGQPIPTTALSPAACCISWCDYHFPEIGVHEAAPIPAPGGEIRLCNDPDAGVVASLYVKIDGLSIAELKAICYAGLAMVARAEAAIPAQRPQAVA